MSCNILGEAHNCNQVFILFAIGIFAYLLGSISPAIILGRIAGVDIKKEGSGNAGTTNVLRILGKKAAIITLLIDICKGSCAVLIGSFLGYGASIIALLMVFVGHVFPVFYGFKGGKGVATAFGGLLALNYILGVSTLGVVVLGVICSQRMSFGSVLGALIFPFLCYYFEPGFLFLGTIMTLIVIYKHKENISRLLKGEEPKIGAKK